MGMLTGLLTGPIISAICDGLFGRLESAWEAYVKKEISKDQLMAQMQAALMATFRDVEVAFYDSLSKTYASFMQALGNSPVMQKAWVAAVVSQLFVLVWHQLCIPWIVIGVQAAGFTGWRYPSSGSTIDYAYFLLMALLGAPAIAARGGPGSSTFVDGLKRLVGK
ncbi:hypothetical protein ACKWRH_21685 [Bradyrhizobium sp. Pa8]|uniref:hypothetical protein n=1 Tax=Bradyrhizobium sp. Pa8 TaxID=3386552 RepID=UPI00403F802B